MPVEAKARNGSSEVSVVRLALLAATAAATVLLVVEASRRPYFPTDLFVTRAIQSLGLMPVSVATWMTAIADAPWCFALVALTSVAAWMISGWRAALLALPIFLGLLLFGLWLSPHIAQPRPSPNLITVIGHPKGYSCPSISGLVYASTFGYLGLLAAVRLHGAGAIVIPILAAAILISAACARIVLGAHWPSDLLASYFMGFLWIELLLPLSDRDAA
jgi:membrane-associated phospholipid phosphatase